MCPAKVPQEIEPFALVNHWEIIRKWMVLSEASFQCQV
jgi:hypothetical protein